MGGFQIRLAGGAGAELGMPRHFLHAARQLADGAGHLLGFALLLQGRLAAAVHRGGQLAGVLAKLARRVGDAPDHRSGLRLQAAQGEGEQAEFIAAPAVDPLAQRVVGDGAGLAGQRLQRAQGQVQHAA
ncbi:hypothetical protein D3C84_1006790 [compost metagenome]